MESNQDLFKQAILDAKAVRETAMAAARTTLAEHFEPKIKEMMRQQLSEDMEEESMMDEYGDEHPVATKDALKKEEGADMEESYLDEILAELNALSEDMEEDADMEESIEEGHVKADGYDGKAKKGETGYDEKAKVSHGDHKLHEADETEEEDHEAEEAGEDLTKGMEAGEEKVVDITVDDLVDLMRSVFAQIQGGEMPGGALDAGTEMSDDMGAGEEEGEKEITLEEILAELEEDDMMEEAALVPGSIPTSAEDVHKVEEGLGDFAKKVGGAIKKGAEKVNYALGGSPKDCIERANTADPESAKRSGKAAAWFAELNKCRREKGMSPLVTSNPQGFQSYSEAKELEEAIKTIKALKAELNEVNLFNAKMLYVNKIFKAKNLNESQKTRVINAFDRVTTVKEVENTYKTLMESIGESKKSSLKESVGFASKPIGNAPARPIVEADAFVNRWQQLAGIK